MMYIGLLAAAAAAVGHQLAHQHAGCCPSPVQQLHQSPSPPLPPLLLLLVLMPLALMHQLVLCQKVPDQAPQSL
jgi:hypothetical protein